MLPSLTQALILALRLRGTALPHDRTIAKQKTGWQNESYCYNNTHGRDSFFFFFQTWWGRQTYWMLSRQRREIQSIAHSQPTRSGKEGVDYASEEVWVLMMITSCHLCLVASLLCDVKHVFCYQMRQGYCVGSVESLKKYKSNHSKPRHAPVTQVQKYIRCLVFNKGHCNVGAILP